MRDPLLRYRVLANIVGVVLFVLVFIAVPIRYGFGHPAFSKTLSPIHGAFYLLLVVNVVLLGRAHRWPVKRIVLVALGGTVPIVSFLVERRVTQQEQQRRDGP